ncbi:FtsX-like permease family protein [Sphingomonas phyllosphaerae]|uniref:FtsX-like permease family protein n=1 Tax=Sphingomonas phyllosphaerae TaxID=257003 RepID=UPI0024134090|nr:FtsX-like permease family protein [Sphingomonas phyllosphaerae]
MDRFALVAFWRSLTRHRLYAALNIGGLALGIAVFLVLGLYVRFETSYEKWLPGWQDLYLVGGAGTGAPEDAAHTQNSPVAAFTAIRADLPGTIGTRVESRDIAVVQNGVGVRERLASVDPDVFAVFRLSPVAGALPRSFRDPSQVVITARTAAKYFGSPAAALGGTLPVTSRGQQTNYRVVAVVPDLPDASELRFDLIAPMTYSESPADPAYKSNHQWNYNSVETFVRLPGQAAADRFAAALPALAARHVTNETPEVPDYRFAFNVRPIASRHFEAPGSRLMVATLGIIGFLTLLVAVVNYVNLATARAGLRAREVGMRKVLGADRATLMRHYLGEAVVTALVAAALGLALAELGVPLINASTGLTLSIRYVGADGVLLPLLLLALLVGLTAGLYPAIVLARVPAAAVLASARGPGGGRAGARVREGLVVFQFAVTIALIVGTAVLVAQTHHVRSADVGYDRQQLLLVRSYASASLDEAQRTDLLRRFAALPGARSAAAGTSVPGIGNYVSANTYEVPGVPGYGPSIEFYSVSQGYFETLRARLLAGRLLDPARPADRDPDLAQDGSNTNAPANVVINRAAARALHFASPAAAIGRTVGPAEGPRTIVGVIENMRVDSARRPVSPTLYLLSARTVKNGIAVIRFNGDPRAFLERAQAEWRSTVPRLPFDGYTAVQALDRLGKSDQQMANLFAIGSILAVGIGCVGLWGLASFTTARRTREIGVRKTLGATSNDVAKLLVGQFLRPVLLANVLAWPLAWLGMRTWLAGFDDRIALSPLFFVGAGALTLVIAIATVMSQSIRASRATPAWALRHE